MERQSTEYSSVTASCLSVVQAKNERSSKYKLKKHLKVKIFWLDQKMMGKNGDYKIFKLLGNIIVLIQI